MTVSSTTPSPPRSQGGQINLTLHWPELFNTIYTSVAPAVRANSALAPKVQFIFPTADTALASSSTLVHEAGVAILRACPDRFWEFSAALFGDQKAFFDVSVVNETRNETYKRLAKLGAQSAGVDEKELYSLPGGSGLAGRGRQLECGKCRDQRLEVPGQDRTPGRRARNPNCCL